MKRWEDQGNGRWKLILTDNDTGMIISTFRGTKDEIADKMADSQMHASRRINELRPVNGHGNGRPAPLTDAQRMQTVADLANPSTVEKGITRVLESVVGPVADLRQDREESRAERETRAAVDAAKAFADHTPEWHPSDWNKERLVRYMQTQGLDPTREASYTQAFEDLSAAQLLQARPAEATTTTDEPADEGRNAPTPTPPPTPTRFSTSIRQSDISGSAPRPTTRLKYSREQLANMSAANYKRLLTTDPELSRCVDHYARQDAAAKARKVS